MQPEVTMTEVIKKGVTELVRKFLQNELQLPFENGICILIGGVKPKSTATNVFEIEHTSNYEES